MTKRAKVLALIRDAGFHGDDRTAIRLSIENRIGRNAMMDAREEGINDRKAGRVCDCPVCRKAARP